MPYEVPVIFSNDKFHAGLSAPFPEAVKQPFGKILKRKCSFTIPYNYDIAKDQSRSTTLSIVHPILQKAISDFYVAHSGGLIDYTSNGQFTLRRPVEIASPYSPRSTRGQSATLKLGLPEQIGEDEQPAVDHLTSYFIYGKYNLLGKFMESREFIRLESRFKLLRSADISKCFYNIYTHSLSWAVKSKFFAKDNSISYSFENEFDALMRGCNYNETNGIVVGPEFSRLFAEIILQDVDRKIVTELDAEKLKLGIDYDIRRYVDDYAMFANSSVVLDKIERYLRGHLQFYKLFLNERKIIESSRPFVSGITLARGELGPILRLLQERLSSIESYQAADHKEVLGFIRSQTKNTRVIVAKYGISFANISGWAMSILRKCIVKSLNLLKMPELVQQYELVGDIATMLLELAFYICSMDVRVRTTYSICQIALIIKDSEAFLAEEQLDTIKHVVMEEIVNIIKSERSRNAESFGQIDRVELYNLLICGCYFIGDEFLENDTIIEVIAAFSNAHEIKYFAYITCKFCLLRNEKMHRAEIDALDAKAKLRIIKDGVDILRDTEEYLFFCEYIGDEQISKTERLQLYTSLFGGNLSHEDFDNLRRRVGFTDWSGMSVEHLLRKKELRPVYAWS
ncbi:RNA-directed DNA polymerase [Methylobacterium sp. J-026]|nr:RNA-directed DNA polymerase [Methylobacterium sp. J-026]